MPQKNREEYLQYQKEYRQKNKEKGKEYQKEYLKKNRDKANERAKEWYKQNKEKNHEYQKEYRQKNKDKIKKYNESSQGIKSMRISRWRRCGVIHSDFDELYEIYLNTKNCELCSVELTEDKKITKTTKCLDHDHNTGLFRNILCNSCNVKRG
tara:strand:- start:35 stop:493 length:459 start_codon:yes stop_codon:yes gene_type:complete